MGGAREVLVTECPYPSVPVPVILSLSLASLTLPIQEGSGNQTTHQLHHDQALPLCEGCGLQDYSGQWKCH